MYKYILAFFLCFPLFSDAKIVGKTQGPKGSLLLHDVKCDDLPFLRFQVVDNFGKEVFTGCYYMHGVSIILMSETGHTQILTIDDVDWAPGV